MKNNFLFFVVTLGIGSAIACFIFPFLVGLPFVLVSSFNLLGLIGLIVAFFGYLFDVILYAPDIRKLIEKDIELHGIKDPDVSSHVS